MKIILHLRLALNARELYHFHSFSAPPKFDEAHAGPVTCRTGETMELVCEASGDDHIR